MPHLLRVLLGASTALILAAGTANAGVYNLSVENVTIDTGEFTKTGIGYNGASPGPVLRFTEGEDVTINVTNQLDQPTSIHWHGLILPFVQDGVPGISFDGIQPGETFTYRFPIVQAGTYWYHSHSGFQEPDGAYGAIVIEPKKALPYVTERDYVVQFADKHPHSGDRIMRNLKMMPDYYNRKQQTFGDFLKDIESRGYDAALAERMAWGEMRMMRSDVEDVQGFTAIINGKGPTQNWTGVFTPGDRIRLRFINSSAMTYFDIRIPGLKMRVVQADGNEVEPVPVDELRIAVAETYDVVVEPTEARAYTIFAESMGRSGYARATLAPQSGMTADVPEMRDSPLLTMADMGMAHGDHGSMDHGAMGAATPGQPAMDHSAMSQPKMDHSTMGHSAMSQPKMDHSTMDHSAMGQPKMDHSTMGHSAMSQPKMDHSTMDHSTMSQPKTDHAAMGHGSGTESAGAIDDWYAPGSGLVPTAANGGKFLSYGDLRAREPLYEPREPVREIEIRLTGNMERYIWSLNGVKYGDADPIRLVYGERVRFKFVNETMMTHPMHLHGMWSMLDVGAGRWNPVKHVISVNPGTTVFMETEVDAPGQWAFHCHLSYHAASGMFRKVVVEGGPGQSLSSGNRAAVSTEG